MSDNSGVGDTPNAITEAVGVALAPFLGVPLDEAHRFNFEIMRAARAVLAVPRVAAGLRLLEAIENAEGDRNGVVVGGWRRTYYAANVIGFLRVIAGVNVTGAQPL